MDKIIAINSPIFLIVFVWSIIWKGLALWRASKLEQKNWFIVLLVINTAGILELIYLFRFAKHTMKLHELKFWEKDKK